MALFSKALPLVSDEAATIDRHGTAFDPSSIADAFPRVDRRVPGRGHGDHVRTGILSAISFGAPRHPRDIGFRADQVSAVITQPHRAVHAAIDSASPHLFEDRPAASKTIGAPEAQARAGWASLDRQSRPRRRYFIGSRPGASWHNALNVAATQRAAPRAAEYGMLTTEDIAGGSDGSVEFDHE